MSSLGWQADGIERAEAAGGVTLERYRRVGFAAGQGVRQRRADGYAVSGFPIDLDPELDEYEEEDRRRVRRRR